MTARAHIEGFHDSISGTVSHLILDETTRKCAVIDSVMGFDARCGRTNNVLIDRIVARITKLDATLEWILETHIHADHLSGAGYLKRAIGGKLAMSENILEVQRHFGTVFNEGRTFAMDGSQFDHLFSDGETFSIGELKARVLHTPGHTPACVTYLLEETEKSAPFAFVGDTLFMPDCGTARCDFPGGDARTLFQSIKCVLALPLETTLFMCHDYPPPSRSFEYISTVAEQRLSNIHIRDGVTEEEFVKRRTARDHTLDMPELIIPSIQINMRGGDPPSPESNGVSYLKIPINAL